MPLSAEEERCISLACAHLGSVYGGTWRIMEGPSLDDLHPSEPSPEVLVTNGERTPAIEVKQLTGDSVWQTYKESLFSLERYLAPSCGGYYTLSPCLGFHLPMQPSFKRHVKREMERVAPTLKPGESGAIHISRSAHIALIRKSGAGDIRCCHTSTLAEVRALSPRLTGSFLLADDGQWEHSFVTDEGRNSFYSAVAAACEARVRGEVAPVSWDEEWELTRLEDDEGEAGVYVIAVTEARDIYATVEEAVDTMLEKAKKKFETRRWADLHVLVFENRGVIMSVQRVVDVVSGFGREELGAIDMILLVDQDDLAQMWPQ